jgi:hypothetical protein
MAFVLMRDSDLVKFLSNVYTPKKNLIPKFSRQAVIKIDIDEIPS